MIVGTTIKALLASAQQELAQIDTARLDAEVLLAAVLMASRESLYAYPEKQVPPPLGAVRLAEYGRRQERRKDSPHVDHPVENAPPQR